MSKAKDEGEIKREINREVNIIKVRRFSIGWSPFSRI
jgi:hypothetical protein